MTELPSELAQAVQTESAKGSKGLSRIIETALRTAPAQMVDALAPTDPALMRQSPDLWRSMLYTVQKRLREIFDDVPTRGLDAVLQDVHDLLIGVWVVESRGGLWYNLEDEAPPPNRFADAFEAPLRKTAPLPPKKIKLDAPQRKILPLSEAKVGVAFDVVMLLQGLLEIGDYTRQPDKAREKHFLFLEDYRRMIWESSRVTTWAKCRELVLATPTLEGRVPDRHFSREAILSIIEANHKRRADNITPLPNVSMLACQRCGRFDGRERTRCSLCTKMFCGRCRARYTELCLADYAVPKYTRFPSDLRTGVGAAARGLCKKFRVDEHIRDEVFVKALAEMGVEVVFADTNPDNGEEVQDSKGKWHLRLKNREISSTKRLLFAAMARSYFRSASIDYDADLEAYFVDACLNVPVEDAMTWPR